MLDRDEIARSKEALRAILDSLPDAIFICRPDGAIVDVNETALKMYGVSRENIIGRSVEHDFSSADNPRWLFRETWGRAVEGQDQYYNWNARKPGDGSEFDSEVCLGRVRLGDKDFIRVAVRDLTAQHRTDCVLRGTQATYVEMVQCVNGIILQLDTEGKVRFINRFAKNFFGYREKEILGRNVIGTIVPETSTAGEDLSAMIANLVRNPNKYVYNENENMRRNGERVWIAWTNKALVDECGEVAGLLATGINITDLKRKTEELSGTRDNLEVVIRARTAELVQSNKALLESERKCRAVFDQTYEFIGLMTLDGRLIEANQSALEFSGVKESDVIGKQFWDTPWWTHSPDMQEKLRRAVKQAAEGQFVRLEVTHRAVDGSLHCVDFSLKPVRDEDGKVYLLIPEGRDITERKRIEMQLRDAKKQAELYVDLMGHDINNMNQMGIGYLEMALESHNPEEIKNCISMSLAMLNDSSRLIGNVEKLQRIAAGEAWRESVDVGIMLEDLISQYPDVPGREITINYDPVTGCTVTGNELLKDVFSNIISNAVKHSTGPLTIDVNLDRVHLDSRDCYRIAIEDDGPGIRDEKKSQLFTRYERGETKAHGRGLGLYLVKAIVESFHGRVFVEDRVPGDYQKGSRFVVMLPVSGK